MMFTAETGRAGGGWSADFPRHVPVTHQPAADLVTIDPQQVLVHLPGGYMRVGFHMPADQLEVRRKDVGQHQIAGSCAAGRPDSSGPVPVGGPGHDPGQALDHRGGVDGLFPVGVVRSGASLGWLKVLPSASPMDRLITRSKPSTRRWRPPPNGPCQRRRRTRTRPS